MFKWVRQILKHRPRVSSKEFQMILVVSILTLIGALAFVWPNIKMVKLAYEYQNINKIRQSLLKENHLLKLEFGSLRSLERIHRLAKGPVGMQDPSNDQIVTIYYRASPDAQNRQTVSQ